MTRLDILRQARAAFIESGFRSCLQIGTGVGKSWIAIEILKAIEQYPDDEIYVFVSSEDLRDSTWLAEFNKFGYSTDKVILTCYQTAYKWAGKKIKKAICDEWDFSLTEKYSALYENNEFEIMLCLTAHIPESKLEMAKRIAPISFTYTTQQAQADGILNKTKFYQVNFDIGHTNTVKVETPNKTFYQSENAAYMYQDKAFLIGIIGMDQAKKEYNTHFLLDSPEEELNKILKEVKKYEYKINSASRYRKTLLHSLSSSRKVVKALLEQIHSESGNKVLINSKRTEQIDKITEHTYHGKNKDAQADQTVLDLFAAGSINTLGVCEIANRGVNLPGTNVIIYESFVGSDTDFQQKHGRGTRLEVDEMMHCFFLMPHFWQRVEREDKTTKVKSTHWIRRPTQAATWFENMTRGFDLTDLEIIEMEHDRSTDTYKLPRTYDRLCKSS